MPFLLKSMHMRTVRSCGYTLLHDTPVTSPPPPPPHRYGTCLLRTEATPSRAVAAARRSLRMCAESLMQSVTVCIRHSFLPYPSPPAAFNTGHPILSISPSSALTGNAYIFTNRTPPSGTPSPGSSNGESPRASHARHDGRIVSRRPSGV